MGHKINTKTDDREAACTLASDLHSQGYEDVAVWSDADGTYCVVDGKPDDDVVGDGLLIMEYDPAKGIPVVTIRYRGPERRRSPREPFRAQILVERVGRA